MAGSFDVFRKYQRSLLVFVAILAMLAFFVLPPFLQMSSGVGGGDPVVVAWKGGAITEGQMVRDVALRGGVNGFLAETMAMAGRDTRGFQPLPVSEAAVVRTRLLAREAAQNGIVVRNDAVNDFLSQWTEDKVTPAQFEELISRFRLGPTGVSPAEIFDVIREILAADRMQKLFDVGFEGDPPGWRWEAFKRLEQQASVEVLPVVVESFSDTVAAPTDAQLRTFFEEAKDRLPVARSTEAGFREPHRAKVEYLVARRETFEAEAAKEVTDEQIATYYEENKESFRVRTPATPPATEESAPAEPAADATPPATETPATEPPAAEPATVEPPATEPPATEPAATEPPPSADASPSRPFRQVAFAQDAEPAAAPEPAATEPPATEPPATETPATETPATEPPATETPAEPAAGVTPSAETAAPASGAAPDAPQIEPLEKVKDEIRRRLASQAAAKRIDAVFAAVTADLTQYNEDYALWKAAEQADTEPPKRPDFDAIAARQGLEAGRSELVDAAAATASGGVAASFDLVMDRSSPMGFRQQPWVDMIYGENAQDFRPVATRDLGGNRYLSWRIEDQPEFVPTFQDAREDVERAWRIVNARPLAEQRAREIADKAQAGGTLAEAAGPTATPPAETVGPFTWLSRSNAPFGSTPELSQPAGLSMPGEAFMKATFALDPGGVAVAFNEPKTVCYAIRMVGFEPAEEVLRERFLDERTDQRRMAFVAAEERDQAVRSWLTDLEKRSGLSWKRPAR